MGCTLAQPNGSERPEEPFENRSDRSIVELFEDIARKNPTSVSVIQPSADGNDGPKVTLKTITYEALAFQKNAVCARLVQSLRDAPDEATIVPVYVHSLSCYKIPVFLGILQAGHSFTVLAAEWGPKRIEDVLASCSCHVMICIGSAVPDFPGRSDHKVLHVDDRFFCQTIAENTPSNSTRRTCESPMAIMFTSGTTGRPKGVVIPDRAVIRLADGHLLPGGNEMVFLHHSPASFDASLLEIFPPLLNGGRVADFLQKSTELSAMEDFMKLAGTTHAFFTTSLYNHIIDHYPSIFAETPSLRRVYSGGESMSLSHMRRAFEQLKHLPDLKLVNVYGPTETGVLSTSVEITESLLSLQENNIGKSISCTQIYVLKQDCCVEACANPKELLCKNGEVGELYVGGRGVCDYLPNAPTSIEPKFLPSPFDPSSRLYRTGDLARQKGDGSIIFVGRKDRQLKLRGQRIEPAEVERVISEVAGIKQCHVLKHNENLVVCYTGQLAKGVEEITTELREQTSWLPAAVPHIWLPFENFQLTANGKLDQKWLRKRLNDRVLGQPPSENAEHSRTRTCAWRISWKISRILKDMSPEAGEAPDEKKLREIGFNSLRVMVLQKKLRDAFGVSLELQQLTNGRAGDLLSAILAALELNAAAAPGPAQPVPAPPQLGGRSESSVQQENLLKEWETAAEEMKTKQNEFVCLHLKGPLDETALTKACQQLCERHEPFRTHFEVQDGKVYQVVEPRKMTMLWKELPDEAQRQEALVKEWQEPFNLKEEAPCRVVIYSDKKAGEHYLMIVGHHLLWDGWSLPLVLEDLSRLYNGEEVQERRGDQMVTTTYSQFASWQRQQSGNIEVLQRQKRFWKEKLNRAFELPKLNACNDAKGSGKAPLCGAATRFLIQGDDFRNFQEACVGAGTTVFKAVLTLWLNLMCRETHSDEQIVGITYANRPPIEGLDLSKLVGFLVTVLPIRVKLDDRADFKQQVHAVAENINDAINHADAPLSEICMELMPNGNQRLLQVLVNLKDMDLSSSLHMKGLDAKVLDYGYTLGNEMTAKEDLILQVKPSKCDLEVSLEYDTRKFTEGRIQRFGCELEDAMKKLGREVITPHSGVSRECVPACDQKLLDVEEKIMDFFTDILNLPSRCTRDDSFLSLGGNSLKSTEVVKMLNQTYGIKLSTEVLEWKPRVAELAGHVCNMLAQVPVSISNDDEGAVRLVSQHGLSGHGMPPNKWQRRARKAATNLGPTGHQEPILIVGGGIAGLLTAIACKQRELPFMLVEQSEKIGGVWHMACNETSRLQTPKEYYTLDDSTKWCGSDRFPKKEEVLEYIHQVVSNHSLDNILCNTKLLRVERKGARLMATLESLEDPKGQCKSLKVMEVCGVVVATGKHSQKAHLVQHHPDAKVVHASKLDNEDMKDKRIVVIGGGSYAVESVITAYDKGAASIVLLVRNKHWVLSRNTMEDLAALVQGVGVEMAPDYRQRLESLRSKAEENYDKHKLEHMKPEKEEPFNTKISLSDRFFEVSLKEHVNYFHTKVDKIDENNIVLDADGRRHEADLIISATGYENPTFPFLTPLCADEPVEIYKGYALVADPRVCFVGFADMVVSHTRTSKVTINLALDVIVGSCSKPSREEMKDWVNIMNEKDLSNVKCHVQWHSEEHARLPRNGLPLQPVTTVTAGSAVSTRKPANESPWLVELTRPEDPKMIVIVFLHAGAGPNAASRFASWAPSDVAVKALQLPGRGNRKTEDPLKAVDAIVTRFLEQCDLEHSAFDGPVEFMGLSMGAIIALETTRELSRQSRRLPARLWICGCPPPGGSHEIPEISNDRTLAHWVQQLTGETGYLTMLNEPDFVSSTQMSSLRADFDAWKDYNQKQAATITTPTSVPVSVFYGFCDRAVPLSSREILENWNQTVTTSTLDIHILGKVPHLMFQDPIFCEKLWKMCQPPRGPSGVLVDEPQQVEQSRLLQQSKSMFTAFELPCTLLKKEVKLVKMGERRYEKIMKLTFAAEKTMDANAALRQAVFVYSTDRQSKRLYVPISAPNNKEFEIVVHAKDGGKISSELGNLEESGSVHMTWPWPLKQNLPPNRRNQGSRVCLVAFGMGIVGVYGAAVRELQDRNVKEVRLLICAKTWEASQILSYELFSLREKNPQRFSVHYVLSQENREGPGVYFSRVCKRCLSKIFPWRKEAKTTRYLVSGNPDAVQITECWFRAFGYSALIERATLPWPAF